nr:uncharacterized protein LOC111418022 [Onthophagus taurus]
MNCSNEVVYRKKLNSKQPWKCGSCACRRTIKASEADDTEGATTLSSIKSELLAEIKRLVKPLSESISELKKDVSELRNFVQHVSDNYDNILTELKSFKSELSTVKHNCEGLSRQLVEKNGEILNLSTQLNQMEQYVRNKNLIISGIPLMQNENCKDIVMKVAAQLNVVLDPDEVDVAHRLKTNKNTTPLIIAQFTRRSSRDALLAKKKLVVTNAFYPGLKIGESIFLNEHLTPLNNKLLMLAKKTARVNGFKFVWFRNKVMVRKDENSPALSIDTEQDLLKKVGQSSI